MDELRAFGSIVAHMWEHKFEDTAIPNRRVFEVRKDYPDTTFPCILRLPSNGLQSDRVDESELLSALREDDPEQNAITPTLEIVAIARDVSDTIRLPKKVFGDLFRHFNIDPIVKQHAILNSYGFHHYGPENHRNNCHTFFFGNLFYSIFWSFNPQTMKTRGILILRTIERYDYGKLMFESFVAILRILRGRLYTPFVLLFVSFSLIAHAIDENMYRVVDSLREIENFTGFGPSHRKRLEKQHNEGRRRALERQSTMNLEKADEEIHKLDDHSRHLTDSNVHIANLLRHVKLLSDMAETLTEDGFLGNYCKGIPQQWEEAAAKECDYFCGLVAPMQRRLKTAKPSLDYLHDRCKSLFQVVFSLLTHEDAEVNIRLAKDSKTIAEATKKDSAAMKTIAFMTMFFLPGTFFAAVFAIPSLKWENDNKQPGVIQHGFGIYWALTAPATVLILALWFIWEWWGEKIKDKKQKKKARKENAMRHMPSSSQDLENGMNGMAGALRSI